METDKKKHSADKRALLDTIKVFLLWIITLIQKFYTSCQEYSEYTTIHGLNYIFASFLTLNDRFTAWFLVSLFDDSVENITIHKRDRYVDIYYLLNKMVYPFSLLHIASNNELNFNLESNPQAQVYL